jgi:hypothetical protein
VRTRIKQYISEIIGENKLLEKNTDGNLFEINVGTKICAADSIISGRKFSFPKHLL